MCVTYLHARCWPLSLTVRRACTRIYICAINHTFVFFSNFSFDETSAFVYSCCNVFCCGMFFFLLPSNEHRKTQKKKLFRIIIIRPILGVCASRKTLGDELWRRRPVSVSVPPARGPTVKESQPILSDLDVVTPGTSCILRDVAFYATVSVRSLLHFLMYGC